MADVGLTDIEGQKELQDSLSSYQETIAQIRTGVASLDMIKDIKIDAYGTTQTLEHVATISITSARTFMVKPWDGQLTESVGGIIKSSRKDYEVNVKPGQIIINLPALTEETRTEYVKMLKDKTEAYRQRIRDVRHRMRNHINAQKENIPESDYYKSLEEIDKVVSKINKDLDNIHQKKELDLLKI